MIFISLSFANFLFVQSTRKNLPPTEYNLQSTSSIHQVFSLAPAARPALIGNSLACMDPTELEKVQSHIHEVLPGLDSRGVIDYGLLLASSLKVRKAHAVVHCIVQTQLQYTQHNVVLHLLIACMTTFTCVQVSQAVSTIVDPESLYSRFDSVIVPVVKKFQVNVTSSNIIGSYLLAYVRVSPITEVKQYAHVEADIKCKPTFSSLK